MYAHFLHTLLQIFYVQVIISLTADVLWFLRFILDEETVNTELAAGLTTVISCIATFFRLFLNSSLVS